MNEKELIELKEKIDKAKGESDRLKGRREYLMQELKNKWDCSTTKEAKDKLAEMKAELSELENKIDVGLEEIEAKYGC